MCVSPQLILGGKRRYRSWCCRLAFSLHPRVLFVIIVCVDGARESAKMLHFEPC